MCMNECCAYTYVLVICESLHVCDHLYVCDYVYVYDHVYVCDHVYVLLLLLLSYHRRLGMILRSVRAARGRRSG